jgi:DNA-binding response OmpR family regulator
LVFLDLRMPGMDGFEVCRQIKSQDQTKRSVVIAMTAFPSPENEQRIRDCGADAFFPKPLDMDALLGKIKEVV